MYPANGSVFPAAVSISLKSTTQLAPAASVPSDDKPDPGLTVELVVNENGGRAPPLAAGLRGKKSSLTVPDPMEAPPAEAPPNGSAVVFAIEMPVLYVPSETAYGINKVVAAGTTLTIVTGPTSACVNTGLPSAATPPTEVELPTGNIVNVTVIAPGVSGAVPAAVTVKSNWMVSTVVRLAALRVMFRLVVVVLKVVPLNASVRVPD